MTLNDYKNEVKINETSIVAIGNNVDFKMHIKDKSKIIYFNMPNITLNYSLLKYEPFGDYMIYFYIIFIILCVWLCYKSFT